LSINIGIRCLKAAVLQRRETEASFCVIMFSVLLRKIVGVVYGVAE